MNPAPTPAEVVQRVYAAFASGDAKALAALAAPASTWTLHGPKAHPYAGTFRGPEGLGQFLAAIGSAVEISTFEVEETVASGATVVVFGREAGRWRASGKPYATTWVHRFRVEGGRVAAFDEWLDTASVLASR